MPGRAAHPDSPTTARRSAARSPPTTLRLTSPRAR